MFFVCTLSNKNRTWVAHSPKTFPFYWSLLKFYEKVQQSH